MKELPLQQPTKNKKIKRTKFISHVTDVEKRSLFNQSKVCQGKETGVAASNKSNKRYETDDEEEKS